MTETTTKENGTQLARVQPKPSPLSVMASRFAIDPARLLEVLRSTVIKPTEKHVPTNEEVAAFVIVANQYGLNPFTKEIHAFAGKGGEIVPIVGVDGWAHLVNASELFDGCEFEEQEDEKGTPLATTCIMHVKGRAHATKVTEWFSECRRPTIPWQTMPRRMLRHKAFIQAARLCFGLSGIYDEDEARDMVRTQADPLDAQESRKARATEVKKRLAEAAPEADCVHTLEEREVGRNDRQITIGRFCTKCGLHHSDTLVEIVPPTQPEPSKPAKGKSDRASEELLAKINTQLRRLKVGEERVRELLTERGAKSLGHLSKEQAEKWLEELTEEPGAEG